jgi:transcriptional regulator with XRE-family HTH domain
VNRLSPVVQTEQRRAHSTGERTSKRGSAEAPEIRRENAVTDDSGRQRRAGVEDIEIGRKIRTLRLERGLSQSLANGIGLSFQQLQKYESGANRVSAGRLQRIAALLGVPVMVFYGVTGLRVKKKEERDDAFIYLQARGAVRVARAYAGISSRATKNALLVVVEALRDKDRT